MFFFNDTATTEIYTLSLHDALPIYQVVERTDRGAQVRRRRRRVHATLARGVERLRLGEGPLERGAVARPRDHRLRSEEHTSELQSPCNLVCRLLLEKKKNAPPLATLQAPIQRITLPIHA